MSYNYEIGKRVIDITSLVGVFEAQEGQVEHIIGKTGMGKTYEGTRRALKFLEQGYIVYTTWRLNLPDYFDERESIWHIIKNIIFFRKHFYRFDYKKNWHFVDLKDYEVDGIVDTEKLATFLATRTDCIFFLDEGQDIFDSHKRAGAIARQSITRTRHMHKTLIIISQRASAVDVNARNNVTFFYKCEKISFPFLPPLFRVYYTEDIDEQNSNPLWVRHDSTGKVIWKAPIYFTGFAKKKIYDAYDSWYLRKNMERSQELHLQAYEVSTGQKISLLVNRFKKKPQPVNLTSTFPVKKDELQKMPPVKIEKPVKLKVQHLRKRDILITT
jgi:hypothetical protein